MKKRILALLMAGVFVLSTLLTGCGSDDKDKGDKGTANAGDGPWYSVQYHDFTLEKDEYVNDTALYEDAMYFMTQKYIEETGENISKLKKMSLADFAITEVDFSAIEEDYYVMDMFVDATGIYFATQYTKWDEGYTKLLESACKILKCDFDGKLVSTIDITEDMSDKGEEEYPGYISSIVCDKDGNIVIADGQSFIMSYDAAGNQIAEIESSGWGNDLVVSEAGEVYYSYMDEQSWEQIFAPVDLQNGKIGAKMGDLSTMNASNFYIDENKVLWLTDETTLKTCNFETDEETEVLNWIDYDINGSDIRLMKKTSDGSIVAYTESYGEEQWEYEIIVMKESDEPLDDKTILTYATFGTDSEITEAIIRFNKNSEEYRIKLVDYYDEEDYEAGMNAYNEAILNGEVADLINVDWSQYTSLARKGMYADLNELMDNDADINRADYFENVLDAYEVDGKLYAMPMGFGITTLVGKTSVLGEESGVTMDELVETVNSLPDDMALMDMMTKRQWIFLNLQGTIGNFVNWETGECSFDSEEFVSILEMANSFPEEYDYENQNMSTPEKIQAGKVLLYGDSWYEITGYQVTKAIFNDEITAIGYPGVGGNGALIQNMGSLFAISAQSEHPEGAWEFVKYMISEDYQKNYVRWYNPIHKAAFDKHMESAMEEEYYTDENGEKVESPKMTYGWDNFEVSVYAATEEEVAKYREILEGATVLGSYEEDIMTMINEEAEPFFKGQKTAKDVANIIQGRVKIYVNENR